MKKSVLATSKWGEPCDRLASLPVNIKNCLDALCCRKHDKLRVHGNRRTQSSSLPQSGSWKDILSQWKLRKKELNACGWNAICWVVFERSYSYLRLSAVCSKVARTCYRVKVGRLYCSHLFNSSTGASFQLITGRVSDHVKLLKFTSLRWREPLLLTKRALLNCVQVLFKHFFLQKKSFSS